MNMPVKHLRRKHLILEQEDSEFYKMPRLRELIYKFFQSQQKCQYHKIASKISENSEKKE